MIKFHQESPPPPRVPTFGEVETNQFFIRLCGDLCMKMTNESYVIIALEDGMPFCDIYESVRADKKIKSVLPKVTKIEFTP